ncbi:S-layer homology domain-containing protein [Peptoniphilus lacydonensis]|uniref:S-layer homology domain-containing protein n=1 Tax=Peptoniphilus lacydonensis TaxID=1673725 RepID=UPI0008DA02EE|nr:S-layer homology domain-containing protein [Peptoniphilus lacydonensis]
MKKKIIAINLILAMFFAPVSIFAKSFRDVKKDGNSAWAYKYVDELSNKNILNGYEDGSFKPNNPVSFLEIMQILRTVINPSEEELSSARSAYMEIVNSNGVMDWAKDSVCYNLYHGTITENTLRAAHERGFLENKVYPNRNTIAVYFARALGIEKNSDASNLKYKDKDKINPLTLEYLPNLVNNNIFTSTGSEGKFNGNFAIKRSEIAVITSNGLKYADVNKDKLKNNMPLDKNQNANKKIDEENIVENNSIFNENVVDNGSNTNGENNLDIEETSLEEAEIKSVNFKGEVIDVLNEGNVNFIKVKITQTDSDKFKEGNVVTINTFRSHKLNDVVEGSGTLGENSLLDIKLK